MRLLGHDLQTALAAISGHAQLLQRQLKRQPLAAPDRDRYLARLDRVPDLVVRASGLVALLQTGAWRSYGTDAEARTDQS